MYRRSLVVVVALAMASVASTAAPSGAAGTCPSDPLQNVYKPSRLKVLHVCITVKGVVTDTAKRQSDGDLKFHVKLDSGQRSSLINSVNNGRLVMEIVPADQPGCTKGDKVHGGYCSGRAVRTPSKGTHIAATGTHVYDTKTGWKELHPIFKIVKL